MEGKGQEKQSWRKRLISAQCISNVEEKKTEERDEKRGLLVRQGRDESWSMWKIWGKFFAFLCSDNQL